MGGRRQVSIISPRPVTRSDLKQEGLFFCGSLSTFLQLAVPFKYGLLCICYLVGNVKQVAER